MSQTLEGNAKSLEEYARGAEWRCAQLMSMMRPMFELYKVRHTPTTQDYHIRVSR